MQQEETALTGAAFSTRNIVLSRTWTKSFLSGPGGKIIASLHFVCEMVVPVGACQCGSMEVQRTRQEWQCLDQHVRRT